VPLCIEVEVPRNLGFEPSFGGIVPGNLYFLLEFFFFQQCQDPGRRVLPRPFPSVFLGTTPLGFRPVASVTWTTSSLIPDLNSLSQVLFHPCSPLLSSWDPGNPGLEKHLRTFNLTIPPPLPIFFVSILLPVNFAGPGRVETLTLQGVSRYNGES